MLSIDVVSTNELVHYLTKRQGKLDPNTFLITITEPDTQIIIPSKKEIYSEQFTADTLSKDHSRTLNKIIYEPLDLVQVEWDKEHYLIIHSYDKNGIARGIADYFFSIFPDRDINKLYYNTFDLVKDIDEEAVLKVFKKLYTLKEYFFAFGLDF